MTLSKLRFWNVNPQNIKWYHGACIHFLYTVYGFRKQVCWVAALHRYGYLLSLFLRKNILFKDDLDCICFFNYLICLKALEQTQILQTCRKITYQVLFFHASKQFYRAIFNFFSLNKADISLQSKNPKVCFHKHLNTHAHTNKCFGKDQSPEEWLSARSQRGHGLLFYCIDIFIDPSFLPLSLILLTQPAVIYLATLPFILRHSTAIGLAQRSEENLLFDFFECCMHVLI